MTSVPSESKEKESRGHFAELLKVEGKLALREPTGLGVGIGLPIILLVVFGLIGIANPGNVASTGYTVLDLYVPVIMVIGFIFLGIYCLPVTLVRYREMGWLRRVSTTPAPPSRLLAAQLILNLVLALAAILIVIFGSEFIFGAPLEVGIPYFILSIVLSIAVIFSLGLVVAALVPSQTVATGLTGLLTFLLLFLSGLWIPPATVGGPLATIMYYSPSGAAVRALLYSVFNTAPPYTAIVTMVAYTVVFAFIAIRYFRWE
ncbi:MAG: ABC transporter permease [Conexivisphaerales archaeon]|jgi:ABC-2 type transport system permease protein